MRTLPCSDVLFVPSPGETVGKHPVQVNNVSPVVTDSLCTVVGATGPGFDSPQQSPLYRSCSYPRPKAGVDIPLESADLRGRCSLKNMAPRWASRSNWQLSCHCLWAASQQLPAVDSCICSTDCRHETILDFSAESTEQPDQPADPGIYLQLRPQMNFISISVVCQK